MWPSPRSDIIKFSFANGRILVLSYRNLPVAISDEQPVHSVTMILPAFVGTQEEKGRFAPLSVEEEPGPATLAL